MKRAKTLRPVKTFLSRLTGYFLRLADQYGASQRYSRKILLEEDRGSDITLTAEPLLYISLPAIISSGLTRRMLLKHPALFLATLQMGGATVGLIKPKAPWASRCQRRSYVGSLYARGCYRRRLKDCV
jgi:hypothetical protein